MQSRPSRSPRSRMRRTLSGLAATAALTVALTACTGGDPGDGGSTGGGTTGASSPEGSAAPLTTTVRIGAITGRLAKPARQQVADRVAAVVDGWIDAAYLGVPTKDELPAAFAGFTRGAAARAVQQAGLMSTSALAGQAEGAQAVRRAVRVDVLAPKGRPAGVRADVFLVFDTTGGLQERHRVTAHLDLTPIKGRWKVFAFDVANTVLPGRGTAPQPATTEPATTEPAEGEQ